MKEVQTESVEGSFETIMLETLFSEWQMTEERAFKLWKNVIKWFKKRNYNYMEVLSGKDLFRQNEFNKDAFSIGLS